MPSTSRSSRSSRATPRATTRAAATARTRILDDLKADHRRVKKAYREFQKMDGEENPEQCQMLVEQVLDELEMHATLEEELLYPAAREALPEEDLVDEAEVEHETVKTLIAQLREMSPSDEKYAARFTVLCEYVNHHVKEEEGEMFPQLERVRLDWESMAEQMDARRAELMPQEDAESTEATAEADDATEMATADADDEAEDEMAGGKSGSTAARKPAARKRSS